MKLQEFKEKSIEEQIKFDFKDTILEECLRNNSIYKDQIEKIGNMILEEKNPILKLKKWKHNRSFDIGTNKKVIGHDCDSTYLALEIMNQCFFEGKGTVKEHYTTENENTERKRTDFRYELVIQKDGKEYCFMGDTMNSFQTITNYVVNKFVEHSKILKGENSIEAIEKLPEELKEKLKKYASLSHTIGNFVLVPSESFNKARYTPTQDFWDLTLKCIREFYLEKENFEQGKEIHTPLCSTFNCDKRNKNWLESYKKEGNTGYENWYSFIKSNYMEDYIHMEDKNYEVKSLFGDYKHDFDNIYPECDDLNELRKIIETFLDITCQNIENRSKRIIEKIN